VQSVLVSEQLLIGWQVLTFSFSERKVSSMQHFALLGATTICCSINPHLFIISDPSNPTNDFLKRFRLTVSKSQQPEKIKGMYEIDY
jgi:hypothetical protein